ARAEVRELGSVRLGADRPADRARDLVRHLLLRPRRAVLPPALGLWASAAELGASPRLRIAHRRRRRSGGGRPRADAGVAAAALPLRDRQALEAGELDPARDRPGRPARDAVADGPLL